MIKLSKRQNPNRCLLPVLSPKCLEGLRKMFLAGTCLASVEQALGPVGGYVGAAWTITLDLHKTKGKCYGTVGVSRVLFLQSDLFTSDLFLFQTLLLRDLHLQRLPATTGNSRKNWSMHRYTYMSIIYIYIYSYDYVYRLQHNNIHAYVGCWKNWNLKPHMLKSSSSCFAATSGSMLWISLYAAANPSIEIHIKRTMCDQSEPTTWIKSN